MIIHCECLNLSQKKIMSKAEASENRLSAHDCFGGEIAFTISSAVRSKQKLMTFKH